MIRRLRKLTEDENDVPQRNVLIPPLKPREKTMHKMRVDEERELLGGTKRLQLCRLFLCHEKSWHPEIVLERFTAFCFSHLQSIFLSQGSSKSRM